MKQTAVDWLVEMWDKNQRFLNPKQIIEQAKAMEKEQIMDAFNDSRILLITNNCSSGRQYFNETFKSE